jgi:hypothetical protein
VDVSVSVFHVMNTFAMCTQNSVSLTNDMKCEFPPDRARSQTAVNITLDLLSLYCVTDVKENKSQNSLTYIYIYSKTCLKWNRKGPENFSAKARFPFNQGTLHTIQKLTQDMHYLRQNKTTPYPLIYSQYNH